MAKRFSDRPGQGRVGIQLLPVNASRRTSNSFTACFLAVDITERMLTKCSAPVVDRKHPETFWRSLTILMFRSAWLLSKGRRSLWRSTARRLGAGPTCSAVDVAQFARCGHRFSGGPGPETEHHLSLGSPRIPARAPRVLISKGRCARGLSPLEPADACLPENRSSVSPTPTRECLHRFSVTRGGGGRCINRGLPR